MPCKGLIYGSDIKYDFSIYIRTVVYLFLTPAQKGYAQCEIETLALLAALELWNPYFGGTTMKCITDCDALKYLLDPSSTHHQGSDNNGEYQEPAAGMTAVGPEDAMVAATTVVDEDTDGSLSECPDEDARRRALDTLHT